jgi:general secretion pathway protein C
MNALTWIEEHRSAAALQRVLQERGAQIVVAILLAAIAIDSAFVLTGLLSRGVAASAPVVSAPPRPVTNPSVELAGVVNAHLFGVATGGAANADAPQTTMPLVLAGVLAVGDPKAGQAIIGANASSAKRYGVGDMIQGGARLTAVYSDRVLIERNGAMESLSLPHTAALPAGEPTPQNPATARPTATPQQPPGALFNGLLRVQPVFTQGKLGGYRVFPGPRGATVLTQLGLRSGDLITAINGTQLDDAARSMQIVQTLSSADSASVTVSRNGELQELNLNLSRIDLDAENANSGTDAASPGGQNPNVPPAYRPGGRFGPARGGPPGGAPSAPADGGSAQGAASPPAER